MSHAWQEWIDRFARRGGRELVAGTAASHAVVIRPARDAELALLHDLAALDSAPPLAGPVLVAVVDGRPWAAHGLDDGRVIADPFEPSAEAVGLLGLRARQLRAAQARTAPRPLRRRLAGRVGAS